MRRIVATATMGVVLTLALVQQPALGSSVGQSVAPTGTVTGLPDPNDLIDRAGANFNAQKTFHADVTVQASGTRAGTPAGTATPVLNAFGHYSVDISRPKKSARDTYTTKTTDLTTNPPKVKSAAGMDVAVRKLGAARVGKGQWKCMRASKLPNAGILNFQTPTGGAPSNNAQVPTTLVGSETLNGVAVWHVRQTANVNVGQSSQTPVVSDMYIAQAGYALQEQVVSLTVDFLGVTVQENVAILYSHYGDPMRIVLPKACLGRSFQLSAGSAPQPLLERATRVLLRATMLSGMG